MEINPERQITVSEHLLLMQSESPLARGRFTRLLNELILSAKVIDREISKAGLVDALGETGAVNIQGERVRKLDIFSNDVICHRMTRSGVICAISSEENEGLVLVDKNIPVGDYFLVVDPLDGSLNIDANVSVGTIFSVYRRKSGQGHNVCLEDVLQFGTEQIAAGYILYGSSTMLVYTCGHGVNGFTLDPSVGEFLLSHPNIKTPDCGAVYSVNEGYFNLWDSKTQEAVCFFKNNRNPKGQRYSGRYIGSLVSDFHRNLLYGGIFMYPASPKDGKLQGKLRLLCEANPMSMLIEQAGGMATDGRARILQIEPTYLHQRTPIFIGSKYEVSKILEILN